MEAIAHLLSTALARQVMLAIIVNTRLVIALVCRLRTVARLAAIKQQIARQPHLVLAVLLISIGVKAKLVLTCIILLLAGLLLTAVLLQHVQVHVRMVELAQIQMFAYVL